MPKGERKKGIEELSFPQLPGRATLVHQAIYLTSPPTLPFSPPTSPPPTLPPPKPHTLTPLPPPPDVRSEADLLPPGAAPGTMPTDLEQSTGLERFEILGKMQGIDVFDMKPLDASRRGTLDNPIIVNSAGDEQFAGCTGFPADSHWVIWLGLSRVRPLERCTECGSVYRMEYIGPPDDAGHGAHGEEHGHGDAHHNYEEPKTMADFVKPEYRGAPPGFVHPGAPTAGGGAHH